MIIFNSSFRWCFRYKWRSGFYMHVAQAEPDGELFYVFPNKPNLRNLVIC